ncbi:MAG: UDP-N-acetylglucosamine 1-carboxyvinyltransferase [Deltaproteobacteria bacterium]|nr:MAG: UDP-N-acetylglucosamine 1-carboxyvinyltransferase [Deltaproteobacteria bacterium]
MQKIVIDGGARLGGQVRVAGAKNAALPLLLATLLGEGEHRIANVPDLVDVRTTCRLLERMGCGVEFARGRVKVEVNGLKCREAPYELVKTMRASVLCLGPLVGRFGQGRVSLPGGCAIGARPIDQHLKGLSKLGAKVVLEHGYVDVRARRLRGASIVLDMPTVTGTENLLMAAVLARGQTVIHNAAREPEVVQLAEVLNSMGARIAGAGSEEIVVRGVNELRPMDCRVIPDRIEAGTLLIAGAITSGDVLVRGARPEHLAALMEKLDEAGVAVGVASSGIRVKGPARPRAVDLSTQPHPGFPTDMQAQFMALMTLARGTAVVSERIFENRFMHVQELRRLGARIRLEGGRAVVTGVRALSGADVMATDLRASASLVLAGLVARGRTRVHRVYHLDRGYQRLDRKLRALGARIRRAPDRPPVAIR